ncbi:hypothetical protein IB234_17265 [Pseudomonas sp. PDM16]|uniref:hypothetical protein n=1 Tax=Pseudomonas sp. PDM16 TaxID=2769292 RepID=UPI00177CE13A|nr:hypothetical protein [Pseudomonas sp. PDM16]MBD9416313.1 hypothetical protein [Pseudomonas sp. PDM16]
MDLQIDEFYKDAAAGMLMLYQAFPRKMALYVEDLIGREEPDEFGLPSTRHQSCLSALLWLAEEGYIRFDSTIAYDALDQAVLTEKGFMRLSRGIPHALPDGESQTASVRRVRGTLAWQLREALGQQNSEKVARLTRLVFESTLNPVNDIV